MSNRMMMSAIQKKSGMAIRYVRWWQWQNIVGADAGTYFGELKANAAGVNVALGKIVTSDGFSNIAGTLMLQSITDNNIGSYCGTNIAPFPHWVEVDLGDWYSLDNIQIWGYHGQPFMHQRVIVDVSNDKGTWIRVFDTDESGTYTETSEGKTIHL